MLQKTPRLKRIQWIAVAFLLCAGIVNYLDRSALSIANSAIRDELGLTAAQMGILLSSFSLAYAIAQLPVGALLDRIGSRIMLAIGMFVWSVAQLAGGLVHTLHHFVITRIFLGIGEAPQFPAGAKVVSEWFNAKERGAPTGIFVASSTIGPAIAPPILTVMMLALGWRQMFIVMGVLGIIVAVGWYLLYRNRKEVALTSDEQAYLDDGEETTNGAVKTEAPNFSEWKSLLKHRTTWGLILGFMGVIYMVWLYLTWLPFYLEHERHLTIAKTGWVVVIPYVFGTIGMTASGYIADALLKRGMTALVSRKWLVCVGLVGAAIFTIPAAYTPSTFMAIVYISAAMLFINMASGASWAMVSVAVPTRLVASLGSFQNFGGYLGGSIAPILTGVIVDRTGSFVNALVVSSVVAVIAAVIYMVLVRQPIRESDIADIAA